MTSEELAAIRSHLTQAQATGHALMPSGVVHVWYYQDVPKLIAEVERLNEALKWHKGALTIYQATAAAQVNDRNRRPDDA